MEVFTKHLKQSSPHSLEPSNDKNQIYEKKNEWVLRDLKALCLNECSLDLIERPHAIENNKSDLER